MEQQDTLLLSERAPKASPASLEDRLRALLELKRDFVDSLRGAAALDDEGFAVAAWDNGLASIGCPCYRLIRGMPVGQAGQSTRSDNAATLRWKLHPAESGRLPVQFD